jgi:hypothetical protein
MERCACGAPYDQDEADRITTEHERQHPVFTAEQQAIIARHEAEDREAIEHSWLGAEMEAEPCCE